MSDDKPEPGVEGHVDPLIFNLLQLKYAMKLEMKGIKHSRGSVYAHVKRRFKLKGNRQSVYDQFCRMHGLVALLVAVLLTAACAQPVTSPSPDPRGTATPGASLVVLTYERGVNPDSPISARVYLDGRVAGQTNGAGFVELTVPIGREITVRVEAPEFGPMEVAATLSSSERWTFYLLRRPN